MTTPTYNDPFGLLRNKKAAELAAGAFTALQAIPPAQRSRYSPSGEDATIELGLGYVQAVLAVLFGVVTSFSFDAPSTKGRVAMRSTGGSTVYHFSWYATSERLILGGFIHAGHPTYQVAVIALCQAIAAYRCGATAPYDELVETWYALVRAMDRAYPRLSAEVPWDKRAIEAACHHADIRPQIVKVCDVLRVALRYQLPSTTTREVGVTEPQVLAGATEGTAMRMPGGVLLDPAGLAAVSAEAAPPATSAATSPATPSAGTEPAEPEAPSPLTAPATPPASGTAPHIQERRARRLSWTFSAAAIRRGAPGLSDRCSWAPRRDRAA